MPGCAYPLPISYYEFQNIRIRHFKSVYQEGGSCGWYAMCNARAIDNLVAQSKPVVPKAIQAEAEKIVARLHRERDAVMSALKTRSFFEGVLDSESYLLAQYLTMRNCYVLCLASKTSWLQLYAPCVSNELYPYVDTSKKYRDRYCVKSPPLFLKKIINDQKVMHFYLGAPAECGTDEWHAVMVTLIAPDKKGEKPVVIYMDSNNRMIGENDTWMMSPLLHVFFQALNDVFAAN